MTNNEPFSIIMRQGYLLISAVLESPDDFREFQRAYEIAAQAIEAQRAETPRDFDGSDWERVECGGSVHESAVAKPCAQPPASTDSTP